jgi:hypothetical protein
MDYQKDIYTVSKPCFALYYYFKSLNWRKNDDKKTFCQQYAAKSFKFAPN